MSQSKRGTCIGTKGEAGVLKERAWEKEYMKLVSDDVEME